MKHARGSWFNVVASVTGVLICVGLPSASARPQQSPYALACNRNHSLTGYTFHMNVALAMHHFPWLHFHISGIGQNVRGRRYIVRFTKMPFFARGFHTIDLSALDPSMWKSRYNVTGVTRRGSMTMFSLLPRGTNRERQNQLRVAYVTLGATYATRSVVLYYRNGGSITLNLTPGSTSGYWLPASGVAQINMPGEALSAHATLTDYATVSQRAVASNQGTL
ncbi:MAG: hypothetical protein WBE59_09075 [Candidatus Cybelea sp.]